MKKNKKKPTPQQLHECSYLNCKYKGMTNKEAYESDLPKEKKEKE